MKFIKFTELPNDKQEALKKIASNDLIRSHNEMGLESPTDQRIEERMYVERKKLFIQEHNRFFKVETTEL